MMPMIFLTSLLSRLDDEIERYSLLLMYLPASTIDRRITIFSSVNPRIVQWQILLVFLFRVEV